MRILEKIFKINGLTENAKPEEGDSEKKICVDLDFHFLHFFKTIVLREGDDGFYIICLNLYFPPNVEIKNKEGAGEWDIGPSSHKKISFSTSICTHRSDGFVSFSVKLFGFGFGLSFQDGNY
jgi:hypothetical protein